MDEALLPLRERLGKVVVDRATAGSHLVERMGRWASLKDSRDPKDVVARELAKGSFVSAATFFAEKALEERLLTEETFPDHPGLWQDPVMHPVMDQASAFLSELGLL